MDDRIARLSGLRRAIYFAAVSRGVTPDQAYRAASSQCCEPEPGQEHTPTCENSWDCDY